MDRSRNISFDKDQIAQVLSVLKKPTASFWKTDSLLRTIQALAIVAGGCWVLFQYLAFQGRSNTNTLEQQRLATQQAEINLKTQSGSNEAALRQQKLAADQAEIALKTQEESNRTSLQQQKLGIQQAQISLDTLRNQKELRRQELLSSVELKRQEVQLNRLKQVREGHQMAFDTASRNDQTLSLLSHKIRDLDGGNALYEVALDYKVINRATEALEISLLVIDYYLGTVKERPILPSDHTFISPIGGPPTRFGEPPEPSIVTWTRLGSWGALYRSTVGNQPCGMDMSGVRPTAGGQGSGTFALGEVMDFDEYYLVRAPVNAYVAFVVNFCFNSRARNEQGGSLVEHVDLSKSDKTLASAK